MMRFLKATLLGITLAAVVAALTLSAGCKGKGATPPKTATPPKAETPKAAPKADPKAADKAKLKQAEDAYKAAESDYKKNPKDFDAAINKFTDAKALAAGTAFDKKCTARLDEIKKAKGKAAEKDKLTKAETAYKAADDSWKHYPTDFDGAIKNFEAVKAISAGTGYDKKSDQMIAKIRKAQGDAAKKPPPPPAVKPITESLTKAADDARTGADAWMKAEEQEKAVGKPERERLAAALPYYLAVIKTKDAEGRYDINSPAAALRVGQIVEKYAANDAERLSAAKYYLVAANLNLGSDAWEKAEKPYVKAGKGTAFAEMLQNLSKKAAARATELAASAEPEDKAQAAKLQKFSVAVGKRADKLAAK